VTRTILPAGSAGWLPPERRVMGSAAERDAYEQKVKERRVAPSRQDFADPISQDALGKMLEKIERHGATAVLIVPPVVARKNFHPRPEMVRSHFVLDFSAIEEFPELFASRDRIDEDHVNAEGAALFTKRLAEEFVAEIERRSGR
jgi:hypothetical protein